MLHAPTPYRGNNPRDSGALAAWYAGARRETALEPELPILDAHHHLYGRAEDALRYRLEDLREDIPGGHNVVGTVYVTGYASGWRTTGPEALRPVGEVDFIVSQTRAPLVQGPRACRLAAGIVAHADLRLGGGVAEVLDALLAAGEGRLRGVRHATARTDGEVGRSIAHPPEWQLLADPRFRAGAAQLVRYGLGFDAWVYHTQLHELAAFADALPDLPIVVDHMGGLIGVAEHRAHYAVAFAQWRRDLKALAARSNVLVKVGGLGMPLLGFGFEHEPEPASSEVLARTWQPYVDACIEAFGPQRCLFESNFPVDKQSCGYTEMWNAFKLTTRGLSVDERNDMFCRTACRVYRLPLGEFALA